MEAIILTKDPVQRLNGKIRRNSKPTKRQARPKETFFNNQKPSC